MKYSLSIHPEAAREFYESIERYSLQTVEVSLQFEEAVLLLLHQIAEAPEYNSLLNGKFRQAHLPVFPFVIVYKIDDMRKVIFVSSIFHTSRNPGKKFRKQKK